ncbi:TPA: transporter substrate-binding domain-containing protein [Salmonella enterica]|nr:arginine ABC transporter substrate-binding protein [Salmonella enterica subsp. enterica serovar Enteritidis]EAB4413170.1 arginine ABC transporter substrate-binding protein [Salmonella enterica]EBB0848485.1 transporter substrate-binding domain-containing protein [Salmonella enterica]EHP1587472.1 arginine ABC transporter substrate-binding protein [Salmonella enterica]HAF1612605.1 transporter substrate-binding domain-containing protein [Salmonella enterica]
MNKSVIFFIITFLMSGSVLAEKIRFSTSATNPPFESFDDHNQLVGFDIDLAKALCKRMQAECTFTNLAFDSLIPALKFRKSDAVIASLDITPERSKQVTFSDPYYENSASVVAKKGLYSTFDDFRGKRIGVENGSTHQKYLQDKHPEIKTVAYDSYLSAFTDLKNGRTEGVFGDTAAVHEYLKTNPQLGTAIRKVTDADYFGAGLGIAVSPDNPALLLKINKALWEIKHDGTYNKIIDKWVPEQDIKN